MEWGEPARYAYRDLPSCFGFCLSFGFWRSIGFMGKLTVIPESASSLLEELHAGRLCGGGIDLVAVRAVVTISTTALLIKITDLIKLGIFVV